jgi:hypothetical protein
MAFDPEALRKKLLEKQEATVAPPTSDGPGPEDSDETLAFAMKCAREEFAKASEAWKRFQKDIKDLAIAELMIGEIRTTGEGLAQAELTLTDEALKGVRAAERLRVRTRILAAMLKKYKKGE